MPRSRRSSTLTRDQVVDAAMGILRREGLGGLTMRAVATQLGVTPMAVYYYVAGKEELLQLVVQRIMEGSGPLRFSDDDWEGCLRRYLLSMWERSVRYPGLSAYLIDQPRIGVTGEALDEGIRFFEDAGFDPRRAPLAWSFAMTYIHGRISVDARLGHRDDVPRPGGLRARDYVDFGIEAVIGGLRALRDDEADPRFAAEASSPSA